MTPDPQLLAQKLKEAASYANTPTSGFPVGAIAIGLSGTMYLGANFEVPGLPLNQAVHAEQAAIANAFAHGEPGLATIATTHTPCGHCRQFINEIANAGAIQIIVDTQPPRVFRDLLPDSFGPQNLGHSSAMFSSAEFDIRLAAPANVDPLIEMARLAAARSYAPHTTSPSGCAIQLRDGARVSGSYLENAAYNPSLSPLLSALVLVVMRRAAFGDMTRVVLVELEDAKISQRASAELVLRGLGVKAVLEVALGTRA